MKIRLTVLAFTVIAALSIISITIANNEAVPGGLPWMDENGVGVPSLYPATIGVVDSTGQRVGTIETRLLDADDFSNVPVTDANGTVVGHFGPNGFWALGEPEPPSSTIIVEEYDDSSAVLPSRSRVVTE